MMASVKALLCDETESEDQGRQSRLFFPGGMENLPGGLGNLQNGLQSLGLNLNLFPPNAAPKPTPAPATTTAAPTTTTANKAAETKALEAKAQLLGNNINSLRQAKAAVEKAIADARRRKRAAATTCAEFIELVKQRKIFFIS